MAVVLARDIIGTRCHSVTHVRDTGHDYIRGENRHALLELDELRFQDLDLAVLCPELL